MALFNPVIQRLEQSVTYQTQKAAIVAHNIANIDTAEYQRVSFTKSLKKARRKLGLPEEDADDYGNGEVALEKEMAILGKTKLRYSSYIKLLGIQYGIYKKVFSQGKG
ncbi:flagellar basal body rod protein FlgB [Candidatus Margulisiibacteriota bacterium]